MDEPRTVGEALVALGVFLFGWSVISLVAAWAMARFIALGRGSEDRR